MTGADGCGCDRGGDEADGRVVAVAVAKAKNADLEHGCFHGIAIEAWLRWRRLGIEAATSTAHEQPPGFSGEPVLLHSVGCVSNWDSN